MGYIFIEKGISPERTQMVPSGAKRAHLGRSHYEHAVTNSLRLTQIALHESLPDTLSRLVPGSLKTNS